MGESTTDKLLKELTGSNTPHRLEIFYLSNGGFYLRLWNFDTNVLVHVGKPQDSFESCVLKLWDLAKGRGLI